MKNPFIESKYTRWYYIIVESAKKQLFTEQTEEHHIIPSSLGGSSDPENLVRLTLRQHMICHVLLTKMTQGKARSKMLNAAHSMIHWNGAKINSRIYAALKEQFVKSKLGVPRSEETKKKIALKLTGYKATEQAKANLRKSAKGTVTKSHAKNISIALTGRALSESHKKHLGEVDRSGSKNSRAILTEDDVTIIKVRLLQKHDRNEIAKEYRVSKSTISAIASGRNWSHLILCTTKTTTK
jgi:hypothetical protein